LRSHRLKFLAALAAHTLGLRHLSIRLDPVMACNLRCAMCYFSNDEYAKNVKGIFTNEEMGRLAEMFFPEALLVVIGCGTEPTLFPEFPKIVKLAKSHGVPNVGFTTNGQRLTAEDIEQFVRYGLDELVISLHGVEKKTYEKFMVNASYEVLHRTLQAVDDVKKTINSPRPQLRINYTVNNDNLYELQHFFEVFGEYGISAFQVRPIIDFSGAFRELLSPSRRESYSHVIEKLRLECKSRGITYLANTLDTQGASGNPSSVILQAVHRRITPMEVWREDFNWRSESYRDFCKRIRWGKHLLTSALSSLETVAVHNKGAWGENSALYDVDLG